MIINFIRRGAGLVCAAALVLGAVSASGCGDDDAPAAAPAAAPLDTVKAKLVVETYAENVFQNYSDVVMGTQKLATAVDSFVAAPSQEKLEAARKAWLDARPAYGQTEGFRFYDGPIDNAKTGPEGRINGWPLDEGYIDYVKDDAATGIVNDLAGFPQITKSVIAEANEAETEKTLSAGWHAVEFLLWGQDTDPAGPGKRSYGDYIDLDGGSAINTKRRGEYLSAVTALLLDDVTAVRDAWAPNVPGNYRATFVAQDPAVSVAAMFKGIATLASSELPEERMNVALVSKEQEDEHSCFSDNTKNDFVANATSIQNVWLGKYGSKDGPGLDELMQATDPVLAKKVTDLIAESVEHCEDIPSPFDQVIVSGAEDQGRKDTEHAVEELQASGAALVEAAAKLGLTVTATLE